MKTVEHEIEVFFDAYAKRFNKALQGHDDVAGTMKVFADCFIEASPAGVKCGVNNEEFEKAIPKGNQFYRDIGTQVMSIVSKQISKLNDCHYMAKIQWFSSYEKQDKSKVDIEFAVIYLLQYLNKELKIFAYITGNEQEVLKQKGLI